MGLNNTYVDVMLRISSEEVMVVLPAKRSMGSMILPIMFCSYVVYVLVQTFRDFVLAYRRGEGSFLGALLILLFLWIIFQIVLSLGSREVVSFTNDKLEIDNIEFGYRWRHRSFQKRDVKQIEFAAVGFSKYGTVTGFAFRGNGKRVKILRGLRSVEAQKILMAIRSLGFDTVSDPAMQMMVEIEQSRRKSFWGLLRYICVGTRAKE
jgi:hypothetical protein